MPNLALLNDQVVTIPILTDDTAGQPVAAPAGDTFSVTSDHPEALATSIGQTATGAPAVVLTPLVRSMAGITVTVSDSAGLTTAVQLVDIGDDLTPTNIQLDVANATHTSQPVPAA